METSIKPLASSIKSLQSHKKILEEKLEDSISKVEKISQKLTAARSSIDSDAKKLREVQDEIDGLGIELSNLTAQSKGSSTKLDLTASHLQTLEARQKEFAQLSEELVKFPEEYRKAIQAASAGWMKALVVKNLEVAIRCVESLKRTKLGRVKIVPLEDLELSDLELDADNVSGIIGPLSKVIRSDKSITPAVKFVFGDTLLATTQRAAFLTASKGQRCVVTSGDLYEPGGGLESGYYRAPLEISNLIPRSTALESLEKTVKSLETVVQRSRSDVNRIETELG